MPSRSEPHRTFGITGLLVEKTDQYLRLKEPALDLEVLIPGHRVVKWETNLTTNWVTVWVELEWAAKHLEQLIEAQI